MIVTTSWDDGHVQDTRLAELLRSHRIAGTFYLALRNRELAADRRLTSAAVRELAQDFEIGSHTLTHPVLTRVPLAEAQQEMSSSMSALSDLVGRPVSSFCYPRGAHNRALAAAARRCGYTFARTVADLEVGLPADPWRAGTSLESARPGIQHWPRVMARSARLSARLVGRPGWEARAMTLFDLAAARDGVFHLWGHSWVLDDRGQWDRLARVLDHIGGRVGVDYLTNAQLGQRLSAPAAA